MQIRVECHSGLTARQCRANCGILESCLTTDGTTLSITTIVFGGADGSGGLLSSSFSPFPLPSGVPAPLPVPGAFTMGRA